MDEHIFTEKELVIHQLFLKAYIVKSPSLFYGKMGIALTLFDYARRTSNTLFSDLGDELIDGILDDVDSKTGFDFATGLAGIAWGIEYLVQQKHVECDTNQVCAEIDRRMEKMSIHRLNDLSLETGLEGLLHYVLIRIKGSLEQNGTVPFSTDFLSDMQMTITHLLESDLSDPLRNLSEVFCGFMCKGKVENYIPTIYSFITTNPVLLEDVEKAPLGLRRGLAGWLHSN